jgi:hypothetical protein
MNARTRDIVGIILPIGKLLTGGCGRRLGLLVKNGLVAGK